MNARSARRFIAYYRVSTDRQGRSGLGLAAQQKAVRDYLDGGAWEIVENSWRSKAASAPIDPSSPAPWRRA